MKYLIALHVAAFVLVIFTACKTTNPKDFDHESHFSRKK